MIYVDQYRSNTEGGIGNYTSDNVNNYIKLIKEGIVSNVVVDAASNTGGMVFSDSCVVLPSQKLYSEKTYYFHGKVKLNTSSSQTFYILLLDSTGINSQQYIKSVTFPMGDSEDGKGIFVDIEFVFQPFTIYDTICFELVRERTDYLNPREACIIYQELSEVQNLIETQSLGNGKSLKKIGVQTRPNALMAINGEEIRVGRSGIYELREDLISITSFSLFSPAKDVPTDKEIEEGKITADDLYKTANNSLCLFNHEKEREIVSFSLDYVYEN